MLVQLNIPGYRVINNENLVFIVLCLLSRFQNFLWVCASLDTVGVIHIYKVSRNSEKLNCQNKTKTKQQHQSQKKQQQQQKPNKTKQNNNKRNKGGKKGPTEMDWKTVGWVKNILYTPQLSQSVKFDDIPQWHYFCSIYFKYICLDCETLIICQDWKYTLIFICHCQNIRRHNAFGEYKLCGVRIEIPKRLVFPKFYWWIII